MIRRFLVFAHDAAAAVLAWLAAFWLRFNFDIPPEYQALMFDLLPWVLAIHVAVFLALGLYRGLWRYASLPDLQRIVLAVGLAALAVPAVLAFLRIGIPVPRTVYVLTPLLLAAVMGGNRLAYRAWREGRLLPLVTKPHATPVLVIGAGDAAAGLLKDLAASPQWAVIGLLDDDARKHGAEVMGVKVYGGVERVGEVAVFWLVGALSASFFEQQKRFVGEIEVANDNTLMALAAALDVREHNTGVHSQRVADYTLRLAREVGVRDKDTLDVFWRGALLHDVGKIGIPDKVLLKPGPLSDEEWVVMRNHPEVGARMLREIEFLRGPTEIVLSHHERYDGAGYPRKLKGAQIPLGARLFAVIDVYDALTTDRAYHTARSHTDALTKIREMSDTHFDPAIVAAFVKIPFEELHEIAKKNQTPLLFASPPVPSLHQVASVLSPGS